MSLLIPSPQPQPQAPGPYPGSGQAKLLNTNHQYYLWFNQPCVDDMASVAVQLSRVRGGYYPPGAAFQVEFSADPGVFEVDIQAAEDDRPGSYVSVGTITSVNGSFVGRLDLMEKYVKFCRAQLTSVTNPVNITLRVTR